LPGRYPQVIVDPGNDEFSVFVAWLCLVWWRHCLVLELSRDAPPNGPHLLDIGNAANIQKGNASLGHFRFMAIDTGIFEHREHPTLEDRISLEIRDENPRSYQVSDEDEGRALQRSIHLNHLQSLTIEMDGDDDRTLTSCRNPQKFDPITVSNRGFRKLPFKEGGSVVFHQDGIVDAEDLEQLIDSERLLLKNLLVSIN
tara:strand:+ start:19477 stop:20073 length:597 start_codon:yes stop_codon:yes gene_type:complete